MTIRIEALSSVGTGGLEECSTASVVSVSSSLQDMDTHCIAGSGGAVAYNFRNDCTGDDVKVAVRMWIDSHPSTAIGFLSILVAGGDSHARLVLNTNGTVGIEDSTGTTRATTSESLPTGEYFTFEWITRCTDNGTSSVRINKGTPTTTGSFDYLNGTNAVDSLDVQFSSSITSTRLDRFYVIAGETADGLTISSGVDGNFAIKTYQPGSGSTARTSASDWPGTTWDSDAHTLDGGTVADFDDRGIVEEGSPPILTSADSVAYNCDASGGNQYNGPSGDSDLGGNPIAAKYMWWAKRGNGSGTTWQKIGGNSGEELDDLGAFDLGVGYTLHTSINESDSVATTGQYSSIGFTRSSGGRDISVAEMFVSVLAPVPAAAPFLPFYPNQIDVRSLM